jgi:hypothetical protein
MALKRYPLLDGKENLCIVFAQSNDWDVLFKNDHGIFSMVNIIDKLLFSICLSMHFPPIATLFQNKQGVSS